MTEFPSQFAQWARHWNYRTHAGSWRAELPRHALADCGYIAADGVLAMLNALSMLRFECRCDATAAYYGGQRHEIADGLFDAFKTLPADALRCSGYLYLESDIDLPLFWQKDKELKSSYFPRCATLLLGEETDEFKGDAGPGLRFWELTIHPNVFTSEVAIITGYDYMRGLSLLPEQWPEAAYENRRLMHGLLTGMMSVTGLAVTDWESDLVEDILMDGFAESAVPKTLGMKFNNFQ